MSINLAVLKLLKLLEAIRRLQFGFGEIESIYLFSLLLVSTKGGFPNTIKL